MPDPLQRRSHARALCLEVASGQEGLFTGEQAAAHGVSASTLSRQVASGTLHRVLPGVFDLSGLPLTDRRRWRAALLWAGTEAALCLRSAGIAWGVVEPPEDAVDVCLARRKDSPASWLRVHYRRHLPERYVRTVRGTRATDVHLTLIELSSVLPDDELEEAVHVAITKGLTSSNYLLKRLRERGQGRRGVATLRNVLQDVGKAGGVPMSKFETRLFQALRYAQLPVPVPQYVVVTPDGWKARPDFAYPEHKVAIEAFSYRWHGNKTRTIRDARRRNKLTALGWLVLDIMYEHLVDQPQEVVQQIADALGIQPLFR